MAENAELHVAPEVPLPIVADIRSLENRLVAMDGVGNRRGVGGNRGQDLPQCRSAMRPILCRN